MSSVVELSVNDKIYGGWQQITIVRSIETLAGSFSLKITDRWSGQQLPWPIREEDSCTVRIDDETVIDGFVDTRNPSYDAETESLTVTGLDRAGALVQNSVDIGKWSFKNATVLDIVRAVALQHLIKVKLAPGVTLPPRIPKLVIGVGDTGATVITNATKAAGLLAVSDGAGGIVLIQGATERASALVQGQNILSAGGRFDASRRHNEYIVLSQVAGTDKAHGSAALTRGRATDEGVKRFGRTLVIRPPTGQSRADAQRLADWTARTRAAKGARVTVTTPGWKQPGGKLWKPNTISLVQSPKLGVDGDMLISQVEYMTGESSEMARLSLVRPDAFTPSPSATVKTGGKGDFWDRVGRQPIK